MELLDDPVQRDRLGRALAEVAAAREAVDAATDGDAAEVERAVAHGLPARQAVEGHCTRILALCERSLGMAAHGARGPVDRMRRDLSLFLRQTAPDAKLNCALATTRGVGIGNLR